MKKMILILLATTNLLTAAHAQYTTYGKIEYERKSNLHQQMEDMADGDDNDWFQKMKAQIPKFSVSYFDYTFNPQYSIYKPGREVENKFKGWGSPPAAENVVFTDFSQKRIVANKLVYEEKFLVQDSMRKLQWKLHDEIRMIANYKCRKATSKIYDSVVVVAFYTDDIMASGGPEMFGGLPGTILQLAIPRLHTTWMATKIELVPPKPEELKAPEKGKKVTQQELYTDLNKSVSKWGKWGNRSIWWSML